MLFLGLFNFAWNQGPIVGWPQSYVYALLILSILAGVGFYFWERRAADDALIPVEVLHKNSLLVYVCLWLGWMSFGIWSLYTVQLWVTTLPLVYRSFVPIPLSSLSSLISLVASETSGEWKTHSF